MFGAENLGRHAFVLNPFRREHSLLGQPTGCKELDGKSLDEQVFLLDCPALRLQTRVDGREASAETLILRNEKNVRIVCGKRLDVVDRRKRSAERPVFKKSGRDQLVRGTHDIGQGYVLRW